MEIIYFTSDIVDIPIDIYLIILLIIIFKLVVRLVLQTESINFII